MYIMCVIAINEKRLFFERVQVVVYECVCREEREKELIELHHNIK